MSSFVVDVESTGTVEPIEPVEVAWLKLGDPVDLVVTENYCERFKPSKAIELGALATHHIIPADLADCQPSSAFKLPEDCTVILGHQVDYDHKVIGSPKVRRIDTLAMARKVWPTLDSHKLGAVLYHIRDPEGARAMLKDSHSALQDCRNCLVVLRAICEIVGPFTTWQAMWEYSEEARVPETFYFGKHKNEKIADTPRDYREWCLRQPDFDPYVLKAIKRTM